MNNGGINEFTGNSNDLCNRNDKFSRSELENQGCSSAPHLCNSLFILCHLHNTWILHQTK